MFSFIQDFKNVKNKAVRMKLSGRHCVCMYKVLGLIPSISIELVISFLDCKS